MANETIKAIQTVSATSNVASIEFTNIPQTYTDLYITVSARSTDNYNADALGLKILFNNSSSDFQYTGMEGNGTSTTGFGSSSNQISAIGGGTAVTSGIFSSGSMYISNYTTSNYKPFSFNSVMENNGNPVSITMYACTWSNSAAITSIKIYPDAGNLAQYSKATLYGVTGFTGNVGGKATGGVVTSDATYYYHTFTNSGMFIPSQSMNVDYLLVGGGAGGGNGASGSGGGGGAGGLTTSIGGSQLAVTAQSYNIIVGAGGSGGVNSSPYDGNSGTTTSIRSSAGTQASAIGGGFGSGNTSPAGNGGSGGGGHANSATSAGGTGSNGNNGGVGGNLGGSNAVYGGGGGGGKGSAGGNYSQSTGGGAGGAGVTNSITGNTYCGGGGGGSGRAGSGTLYPGAAGGSSIGGAGANGGQTNGYNAVANTGSGGGGGGYDQYFGNSLGGNGSSGIVVIRYAK